MQKATVAKIRQKKTDYAVTLKKNWKHLYEAGKEYLTSVPEERTYGFTTSTDQTIEKDHGRIKPADIGKPMRRTSCWENNSGMTSEALA